jgi:glutathione S-transferase
MATDYILYGAELSLFTRKLESALVWYDIPFSRRAKTSDIRAEIDRRSGTHQMPALLTPENWMLADTTPILMLLDARHPRRAMFPPGPAGVMVHVIEEFFDEWVARVMVHYRWHYPASAQFAIERLTRELLPDADEGTLATAIAQSPIRDWGLRACRATGTGTPHQQRAAEQEYEGLLEAISQQLTRSRFLLGDRPCAVDAIVLGGLLAHTYMDPDPKKVVARYPRVVQWCTQDARQWDGDGELAPFPTSTPFAHIVLSAMATTYVPFILGNSRALASSARAFTINTYGADVSYLARPYPERSRRMISDRIRHQLDQQQRSTIDGWLHEWNLHDCFEIAHEGSFS